MGSFCATAANKRQHVNSNTQLIHVGEQSIRKTSVSSTTKITTYSPPANQEKNSRSTFIPCVDTTKKQESSRKALENLGPQTSQFSF